MHYSNGFCFRSFLGVSVVSEAKLQFRLLHRTPQAKAAWFKGSDCDTRRSVLGRGLRFVQFARLVSSLFLASLTRAGLACMCTDAGSHYLLRLILFVLLALISFQVLRTSAKLPLFFVGHLHRLPYTFRVCVSQHFIIIIIIIISSSSSSSSISSSISIISTSYITVEAYVCCCASSLSRIF